jgi:hypothetical protein
MKIINSDRNEGYAVDLSLVLILEHDCIEGTGAEC